MITLRRFSTNVVEIINSCLKNQKLVNYLGFDQNNPEQATIVPSTIAPKGLDERFFVYPFSVNFTGKVRSQLHIYYPDFKFVNNTNAVQSTVFFDIVVHKSIWLVQQGTEKMVRPLQIADAIFETFNDKLIKSVGKMHFLEGHQIVVNEEYSCIRLVATITDF